VGALLTDSSGMADVSGILSQDAFYDEALGKIYGVIRGLYEQNRKIDLVSVMQGLQSIGQLEEVGGAFALSELSRRVSSSANIAVHAMYIHQSWVARRLIETCLKIESKAYDETQDVSETIGEALKQIEAISGSMDYNTPTIHVGEASRKAIELYDNRKKLAASGIKTGIDTGLYDLNSITNGGWRAGQLIIVAARPAMGKTSIAMHFARSAALSGIPVLVFSLEMSAQSITNKFIFSECDIDSHRFSVGKLTDEEEKKLYNASNALYSLPVTISDCAGISIHKIRDIARNGKRMGKYGMIVIDYLQLIDMRNQNRSYNREQEVSQVSRSAKIIAKELEIPVILLSQLSREVEKRGSKIPLLSDLRESGAIEQDADMVIFIHRPEYYNETNAVKGEGILRVAKNREGETGDIVFRYNYNLTRIADKYGDSNPF
jgi:replicative DNA helicase